MQLFALLTKNKQNHLQQFTIWHQVFLAEWRQKQRVQSSSLVQNKASKMQNNWTNSIKVHSQEWAFYLLFLYIDNGWWRVYNIVIIKWRDTMSKRIISIVAIVALVAILGVCLIACNEETYWKRLYFLEKLLLIWKNHVKTLAKRF